MIGELTLLASVSTLCTTAPYGLPRLSQSCSQLPTLLPPCLSPSQVSDRQLGWKALAASSLSFPLYLLQVLPRVNLCPFNSTLESSSGMTWIDMVAVDDFSERGSGRIMMLAAILE